jgi:hypothetical protein
MTMNIRHVFDFNKALAQGPYVWPGGYPLYFVCADGGALSFKAAQENAGLIRDAIIAHDAGSGWCVVGMDVNYEDTELTCDHTGERIESAYGEEAEPLESQEVAQVPNLDAMNADELKDFYVSNHSSGNRTLHDAAAYAINKATAMRLREEGDIARALQYERLADAIYDSLPDAAKW